MKKHSSVFGLIVIAIAGGIFFVTSPATAKKSVSWNPASFSGEVVAGESATIPISFTALDKLPKTVVRLSTELARVATVSPVDLGEVSRGQVMTLTLIVSPDASTTPQTLQGSISLHKSNQHNGEYGSPLQMAIQVKWPSVAAEGVEVQLPPTFKALGGAAHSPEVSAREGGAQFLDVPVSINGEVPIGTFGLLIHQNQSRSSLEDWFATEIDVDAVLQEAGTYDLTTFANGKEALIATGPVPEAYDGPPLDYAYILSPGRTKVASISLSQDHELYRLGYSTPEEQEALLRSIAEQLTFNE